MKKGIFLVTEVMKNIIEALNQLGTEKIQEAGSVDALTAAIKGYHRRFQGKLTVKR